MHLTDLKLRSLSSGDGQRDYPDDAITGLSVRVGKRTKTFMLSLRKPRRRRVTLGHYPELSLSQARERARDLLAEARLAKEVPISLSFHEAKEQFKKLHVPTMRPGTQKACIWQLDNNFSKLEKRPITSPRTSELAAIIDSIKAPSRRRNGGACRVRRFSPLLHVNI
jgi:hypothetical protein